MNREDIIRMAREAGGNHYKTTCGEWFDFDCKKLERFANAAYETGVASEREECARLVQLLSDEGVPTRIYANVIRARGEK